MIMGKRLIGLIIILSTFFTYIIYSKVKPASLLLEQRIDVQTSSKQELNKSRNFNIVPWTSFWNWEDFGMGHGNQGFQDHQCAFTNCFLIDKSKIYSADAILLHGPAIDSTTTLRVVRQKRMKMGHSAPLIIYFNKEPPTSEEAVDKLKIFDDLINITMTYRKDSNVLNSFGRLQAKSVMAKKAKKEGKWAEFSFDKEEINVSEGRSLDIAWMVSNCHTDSKREELVDALRNLPPPGNLQIDIYGKCGSRSRSLPPSTSSTIGKTLANRQNIYAKTLSKYKFYLSLENSLCRGYITEKLFLAMSSGTLPIAYGGLSKKDYLEVVPPHSFIYAEDFPTVQDLGQYLVYLSQNQTAFNSYFWWKKHYQISSIVDEQWKTNCDLCEKINQYYAKDNPEEISAWNQLYRDFGQYWAPSDICRQPGRQWTDLLLHHSV